MLIPVRSWRDRARAAWIQGALLGVLVGAVLVGAALSPGGRRDAPLLLLGALHLVPSAFALVQFAQAGFKEAFRQEDKQRWRRGELALLSLAAAYCALVLALGIFGLETKTRTVAGKPVEIRSESRKVFMPDGGAYAYRCWKDSGRTNGTCPAERRWAELPRWPEPERVEMQVDGNSIHGLTMDGVVIVDPAEFRTGARVRRVLMLLVGVPLCAATAAAIVSRLRRRSA